MYLNYTFLMSSVCIYDSFPKQHLLWLIVDFVDNSGQDKRHSGFVVCLQVPLSSDAICVDHFRCGTKWRTCLVRGTCLSPVSAPPWLTAPSTGRVNVTVITARCLCHQVQL